MVGLEPATLLRSLLTIIGAWGCASALYVFGLYFLYRDDGAMRVHYGHVMLVAAGYAIAMFGVTLRAVLVPAVYTWTVGLTLPGLILMNVGVTLLLLRGHLQHPKKEA